MPLDDKVASLLHAIYGAALTPELWPAVLGDLAELTRARMTSLIDHRPDGRDQIRASFNLDPTYTAIYEQHFYKLNLYSHKIRPLLREGLVAPHEIYSSDQEHLRSEFYNDFNRKIGILRNVASVIAVRGNTFKLLSVNRGPAEPRFSAADVQLIAFFVPHVRRALEIQQRIAELEAQPVRVPNPDECAASLGLTKAEAKFVALLASGLSVKEICSRLQIQLTTARTHLRHLYEKTNTTRQAELVSCVLRERDRTGLAERPHTTG